MERTLLGEAQHSVIERSIADVNHLTGNTAEVGVYMGGVSKFIANHLPHKKHYCFDTFTGIPNAQIGIDSDLRNGEFFCPSIKEVISYLSASTNIVICQGYFPKTAIDIKDKFCLVHIDGDTHQTTKDSLEFFYPKMVVGGLLIFDDWHGPRCLGVAKAITKFMVNKPEQIVTSVPASLGGQCIIKKSINVSKFFL